MKISLDWVKDFTDIPEDMTPQELGMKFTLSTCEVEGVETTNQHMEAVTVAQITAIEPHPEADKLNLVTFKCGSGEKRVVCGAPNVAVGLKVPFAPIGTTLPGGFTLEPKKIRGILSEGMLCAEDELGLGEGHDGLLILSEDAKIGLSMAALLGLKKDILFDIDNKSITNRPDLWGHYGMAREFAAVFSNTLKNPLNEKWMKKMRGLCSTDKSPVTVTVDKECACLGYLGLSVDNITIQPSPSWMQQRLLSCGLRPINNIVDISNYVMLELGQPNHIFDRETIKGGQILVKEMDIESTFITLDETERKILPGDTMVCDSEGPSVIGGIMGGLTSSVKDDTTSIFIEAANWVDVRIRRTSTRLGLRTDSSQRYEKSLDTNQLEKTVFRILELVRELCPEAKVVGKVESDGVIPTPELKIELDPKRVNSILGTQISSKEIVDFLEPLEYTVKSQGDILLVSVPSFRATKDVEVDADIIEDVGRLYGYDNLVPQAPLNEITAVNLLESKKLQRKIIDFMVYNGRALEIFTYPMVGERLLKQASWPELNEKLTLANALSPEVSRMRPSLVPPLLEKTALNQKNFSSFRLFEMGRSYWEIEGEEFSQDRYQLGVVFFDKKESPFMDLLNLMQPLLSMLNLNAQFEPMNEKFANPLIPADWAGVHPTEYLNIKVMGKNCGFVNTIHPVMTRQFKIKGNVAMAVFDITDFMDRSIKDKTKYKALPKFPSSDFDCTVVADAKTPVGDILRAMNRLKVKEAETVKVVDIFKMSEAQKAVTIRTTFLDREKTLSPEFLREVEGKVVETLEKAGFPLKV
jgi:phenylalanyl-tRNA synthetase beta chain